jgi:single-strand DNA-binding protein
MNLNKAFIIGRLTNDPEVRSLPSGQPVCNFSVATNRVWKDKEGSRQEDTQFHNIVAFGRSADIASRYLSKGGLVFIEGRIQTRSWEDQAGGRKYRTEVIVENLQLGPRPGGAPAQAGAPEDRAGSPPPRKEPKEEEIPIIEQDTEINTDDIPF